MANIIILNIFIGIPRRIISHNRIIATIRIHIEANQIAIGIHIPILIQEPSPSRVIISALQVVQPRLGIVVIPAVAEGVIQPNYVFFQRGAFRNNGYSTVTPSVVSIGTDLLAACVVYRDNIPLEILLEIEGIEDISGVALGSVLQADGRAGFDVQVDQQEIAPRLADDLCTVQGINVVGTVYDLVGADAVGVIPELDKRLSAVAAHLLELTAVPVLQLPAERGALRVAGVTFYKQLLVMLIFCTFARNQSWLLIRKPFYKGIVCNHKPFFVFVELSVFVHTVWLEAIIVFRITVHRIFQVQPINFCVM